MNKTAAFSIVIDPPALPTGAKRKRPRCAWAFLLIHDRTPPNYTSQEPMRDDVEPDEGFDNEDERAGGPLRASNLRLPPCKDSARSSWATVDALYAAISRVRIARNSPACTDVSRISEDGPEDALQLAWR